jgi:hypothetical protein
VARFGRADPFDEVGYEGQSGSDGEVVNPTLLTDREPIFYLAQFVHGDVDEKENLSISGVSL